MHNTNWISIIEAGSPYLSMILDDSPFVMTENSMSHYAAFINPVPFIQNTKKLSAPTLSRVTTATTKVMVLCRSYTCLPD
jgi:hypothetical protein